MLNNCIGRRNYRSFVFFLIFSCLWSLSAILKVLVFYIEFESSSWYPLSIFLISQSISAFLLKRAASTYYPNKTRKILLATALAISLTGIFTAEAFKTSTYSMVMPAMQAITGYVYVINIKEFTMQYVRLVVQGFTLKEWVSRVEASRTY
jgi:hypothetical protein